MVQTSGGHFLKQKSALKQKGTANVNGGDGGDGGGGVEGGVGGPLPKRIRRRDNHNDEDASCVGWVEVPDQVVQEKIGHSFRNLRTQAPIVSLSLLSSVGPEPIHLININQLFQ
jgi:hypothetical protein